MLTITSPPILMLVYADHRISPFEGGRGDVCLISDLQKSYLYLSRNKTFWTTFILLV